MHSQIKPDNGNLIVQWSSLLFYCVHSGFDCFGLFYGTLSAPLFPALTAPHRRLAAAAALFMQVWRSDYFSLSLQERHADSLIQNQHYQVCTARCLLCAAGSLTSWDRVGEEKRIIELEGVGRSQWPLSLAEQWPTWFFHSSQCWIQPLWHYIKQLNIRFIWTAS